MTRADVVVVGAGPAGSITSLLLARRGFDVTLLERTSFPRRKVCGEYLNVGAARLLDAIGLGEKIRGVASLLQGIRLLPPAAQSVELRFQGSALAIARETLDAMLLDAARAAGAKLVQARAIDVVVEDGRATGVVTRDETGTPGTQRGRFIVGADGTGSIVARRLGLVRPSRGPRRFAVGGHYRGFGALDGFVEMYVGAAAYFAINPLDATRANVMVVVRERALAAWSRDVDGGVTGRAAELGRGHRSFSGAERIGPRVAVGPLAFDTKGTTAPGALLVGDAGGFLNPFTGQGVYLALRGAIDAAEAISSALRSPKTERDALATYALTHAKELRMRVRLSRLVTTLVDIPLLARRATARIARAPEAAETLLGALSGTTPPERALNLSTLARLLV